MELYYIIGEFFGGEKILFCGNRNSCVAWIWDNCDVGDLKRSGRRWRGRAYYDVDNVVYSFLVDKFYP